MRLEYNFLTSPLKGLWHKRRDRLLVIPTWRNVLCPLLLLQWLAQISRPSGDCLSLTPRNVCISQGDRSRDEKAPGALDGLTAELAEQGVWGQHTQLPPWASALSTSLMIWVPGWRVVGGMCHRSEFLNNPPFARVYRSVEENGMERNLPASKNHLASSIFQTLIPSLGNELLKSSLLAAAGEGRNKVLQTPMVERSSKCSKQDL